MWSFLFQTKWFFPTLVANAILFPLIANLWDADCPVSIDYPYSARDRCIPRKFGIFLVFMTCIWGHTVRFDEFTSVQPRNFQANWRYPVLWLATLINVFAQTGCMFAVTEGDPASRWFLLASVLAVATVHGVGTPRPDARYAFLAVALASIVVIKMIAFSHLVVFAHGMTVWTNTLTLVLAGLLESLVVACVPCPTKYAYE